MPSLRSPVHAYCPASPAVQDIPPGTIPSSSLSNAELVGLGLNPETVRQYEAELAEMGLGLGISFEGIVSGIGKGISTVAKYSPAGLAVQAAKKVTIPAYKAGGRIAAKLAPKVLPTVAPVVAGVVGGPAAAAAARVGAKALFPGATMPPADLPAPPAVGDRPALLRASQMITSRAPDGDVKPTQGSSLLDRIKGLVERAAPAIPQVVEALSPQERAPVPSPVTTPAFAPPAPAQPATPPWLIPAAIAGGGLLLILAAKR